MWYTPRGLSETAKLASLPTAYGGDGTSASSKLGSSTLSLTGAAGFGASAGLAGSAAGAGSALEPALPPDEPQPNDVTNMTGSTQAPAIRIVITYASAAAKRRRG